MTECRIGIVGAGVIAASTHIPVLRSMPGVRIAWIADVDHARAARLAEVSRTHAIDIAAVPETPVDIALLAIPLPPRQAYFAQWQSSATAILAEKPLANTLAEHDAIIAAFPDWQVGVGYQRRTYAQYRLMAHILRTGTFGPLRRIDISEGGRITRSGGGGDYQIAPWAAGGGVVKNLGCHALDLAMWLTGAEQFTLNTRALDVDADCDLACRARFELRTAAGTPCILDFTCSFIDSVENHMAFEFDHARLVCATAPSDHIVVTARDGQPVGRLDASSHGAVTSNQAFFLEWRDMIAAAAARTAQPMSAAATRPVSALMDALLAAEGTHA